MTFSFMRWHRYFHSVKDEMFYSTWPSLNRTFNLSLHENICTIALITIHYFSKVTPSLIFVISGKEVLMQTSQHFSTIRQM